MSQPEHAPGSELPPLDDEAAQKMKEVSNLQLEMIREALEGSSRTTRKAQETLESLPDDFRKGLDQVALMFWIQFIFGFVLLISAIVLKLFGHDILTWIFGATGGVLVINSFITTSPMRLQKNRVDLGQWALAYFNWFNSVLAVNNVMTTSLQSGALTWEVFKESQLLLLRITEKTLRLTEDYCEFRTLSGGTHPQESPDASVKDAEAAIDEAEKKAEAADKSGKSVPETKTA